MSLRKLSIALCIGALTLLSTTASAELTKAEVEQIVHDYIINNPDVLIEAGDKIKVRQAELEKEKQKKLIDSIYTNKAIPSSGATEPKHKIVEFFDYNCGYCKRARTVVIDALKEHPDTRYYYMEFPILSEISETAAQIGIALYAADKNAYATYNSQLMTSQTRLTSEAQIKAVVEEIIKNSNSKITWDQIKKISQDNQVKETLKNIRQIALQLNVTGTPAFIVDGTVIHGAPRSKEMIEDAMISK